MPRYLLDTNILSNLIRDPSGVASEHVRRVGEDAICTSIIAAGELRYGAVKLGAPRLTGRVEALLERIEVLPLLPPVEEVYADVRAELERRGRVIGSNDLWIAAHALATECNVVTANEREFIRVDGLHLENWLSSPPQEASPYA